MTESEDEVKKSFDRVHDVTRDGKTKEDVRKYYETWANDYDKDLTTLGYKSPRLIGEAVKSLYAKDEERKKINILDIAAGTGLVGEMLQRHGFTKIDALDGCQEMLDAAKDKQVYSNFFCELITTERTPSINNSSYDVLTVGGTFVDGHLDETVLPELARMIKSGGYFVTIAAVEKFGEEVDKMIREGTWSEVKREVVEKLIEPGSSYGGHSYNGVLHVLQKC